MYRNSVDRDIQSMLRPLNIMQTSCFYPKYSIKNNVIQPNSRLTNIKSICGTIFFISVFLQRLIFFHFNHFIREYMKFIYVLSHFDFWYFLVAFILNCYLNITQVHENIKFVLKIQKIHRFFNDKKYLKFFTLVNWFCVLWIYGTYILFVYYSYRATQNLVFLSLFCFDANMIYAIRCITYLKDMLDSWNEEITRPRSMRDIDMKHYYKAMLQTYTDILSSYDTVKLTFKYFVSNFVTKV